MDNPRYPQIRIAAGSGNPLVLVARVREAMRRARLEKAIIQRFSDEALANADLSLVQRICARWVELEEDLSKGGSSANGNGNGRRRS